MITGVLAITQHLCVLAGDNCEVRDPRHGHLYDLKPLAVNDTVVKAGEYTYYLRVCGKLSSSVCSTDKSKEISSCQEKRGPLGFHKVAGAAGWLLLLLQSVGWPGEDVAWRERGSRAGGAAAVFSLTACLAARFPVRKAQ